MIWHDLQDPKSPELDRLAEQLHLHPLHIEDCRHGKQRAKVEEGGDYVFVVLKAVHGTEDGEVVITEVDCFLGRDSLITVQEGECPPVRAYLDHLHGVAGQMRADQLFYRIMDGCVDAYSPVLDRINESIDTIEDTVIEKPAPATLERIIEAKRGLSELRRVLGNMRDVAGHLQRIENGFIQRDLSPFLRDIYDHLARNLDTVEMQRDILTGTMDIYLSSVANRTNQVMKVLTVLGTIALPAIVISGFYGMNTKGLPGVESPYGAWIAGGLMAVATAGLLAALKKMDWL